ncbi:MAG: response regulator transcription factor [Oscillospiraceae bacterium]|nr:response regulator transcription factor [Oscillospiraceae bacterium]
MKRILVCEDEDTIRDFVVINLKRAGYDVTDTGNGEDALEAFEESNGQFDIALLDIMMPGIDGTQVCKILREKSKSLGIIMLSAKAQEMDKVNCLMLGADDYVTKPFSPSELMARVDAVYRRVEITRSHSEEGAETESDIVSGAFKVSVKSRTITKNDDVIELTQVEYQILEFFIRNNGTALDRKSILKHIWGESYFGDDKIVDVNIRRLRMKIEEDPSNPLYIQTIWGFGYKWDDGNG